MKQALDFLNDNRDVAFATVGADNRPMIRVFQIMKMEGTTLYFATGPHKRVYAELKENPAMELLAMRGNVSVRVDGDAVFDVDDAIQEEIYNTNPVLSRLYKDYKSLVYFRMDIASMDYYDLTPTPPVLRHYDGRSGKFTDLDPYGSRK